MADFIDIRNYVQNYLKVVIKNNNKASLSTFMFYGRRIQESAPEWDYPRTDTIDVYTSDKYNGNSENIGTTENTYNIPIQFPCKNITKTTQRYKTDKLEITSLDFKASLVLHLLLKIL
ncbi:TPA: hypothetical protein ACGCM8_005582 [Bacillus cereus]